MIIYISYENDIFRSLFIQISLMQLKIFLICISLNSYSYYIGKIVLYSLLLYLDYFK
jgi:hypothetical protein